MKKGNSKKTDKSIKYSKKHDVQCIIDGKYDLLNFIERELTSAELYFLKYITTIESNPIGSISHDWTYDYHLDFQDVLNQFVGQGLVNIEVMTLGDKIGERHTIKELKGILNKEGLPVNGKKSDLIERLIQVYDKSLLQEYENERDINYKLTEKGKILIKHINPSISKDMELEDKSYRLVLNGNIEEAYRIILDSKKTEYPPRLDKEISKYSELSNLNLNLPEDIKDKQKNIISCIIVGDIFRCATYRIKELIKRLVGINLDDRQIDNHVYYVLSFISPNRTLTSLRNDKKEQDFTNPIDDMDNKLKEFLSKAQRKEAVIMYRKMTGYGLKEANVYIDNLDKKMLSDY